MTVTSQPLEQMMSARGEERQFVDIIGRTWQEHPDWAPGDPWEDRFIYPEDEGLQTIGWQVVEWAQTYVNSPDGTGKIRLTPEQQRFILWWYAFYPETALPRYREACLVRSKGWGKDPLAALLCIVEFVGPCRLMGWGESGEPVAGPHWNPIVQLAAVSKDQNRNTSGLFPVMMDQSFQDLFEVSLGIEVSYAQSRKCTLDVLSANFRSKEGARPSFVIENEIHHWVYSKGGLDFHDVLGRNLVKRGASDPWARRLMITNAYKPSEESVARMVREGWEDGQAGRAVDTDTLLYDSIEARADVPLKPPEERWTGKTESGEPSPTLDDRIDWLAEILVEMRGDSFWLSPRQTAEEILSPQNQDSISQSRRFYLNQVTAAEEAWLDRADIRAAIDERVANMRKNMVSAEVDAFEIGWQIVGPDEPVVLFFDGSKSNDATGCIGCRVSDGYCFTVGVWQMPTNLSTDEKETWRVDRDKVDAQIRKAMARFNVVAFWGDPSHAKDETNYSPYWDELFDKWHERWSDDLRVWAVRNNVGGHAIQWDMTSPQRTAEFVNAAQKTVEDFESLEVKIDGHPALVAHLTNAQEREDEKNGITLGKESRYSPRKIDLAVCLVGARMLARIVKLGGHDDDGAGNFWGA